MARRSRGSLPEFGVFHVTARGAGDSFIYTDDTDRLRFLYLLGRAAKRFDWTCHAYCLMSTHYHLVVEARREALSKGMARLNGTYAQEYNERHGRHGHLFGGRFVSYLVDSEEHFDSALRYVLDNPVRAGLCPTPEAWQWSGLKLPTKLEAPESQVLSLLT